MLASKTALVGEPGAGLPGISSGLKTCASGERHRRFAVQLRELDASLNRGLIAPDSPVYLSVDVSLFGR